MAESGKAHAWKACSRLGFWVQILVLALNTRQNYDYESSLTAPATDYCAHSAARAGWSMTDPDVSAGGDRTETEAPSGCDVRHWGSEPVRCLRGHRYRCCVPSAEEIPTGDRMVSSQHNSYHHECYD